MKIGSQLHMFITEDICYGLDVGAGTESCGDEKTRMDLGSTKYLSRWNGMAIRREEIKEFQLEFGKRAKYVCCA